MKKEKFGKTFRLTLLGILSAIIFIQNFVPFLGYIPFQPFNPQIIHVTVIIGAVLLGPKDGAILGGVWGLICLFRAFAMPTSPIDPIVFTNPLISVLPRILIGLVAGALYNGLKKLNVNGIVSSSISGIVGSFTNTILVLGLIYIFYKVPYANFYGMDVTKLLPALLTVVFTNGLIEAIIAGILTPLITKPLMIIYKKKV